MKSRIFEVVQQAEYLNEDQIKIALAHKIINRYAYIFHDKDNKEDGTHKEDHYHIVIELTKAYDLDNIAKWFNVQPQYVEVKKGHGAFLDCVEYLTHEHPKQQEKGKYRYPDEEVKANFNFREALDKKQETRLKYGKDILTEKERMRMNVLVNGMTLIEAQAQNPLLYSDDMDKLKKLRLQFLYNQKPPETRINYYISGRGGLGKGLCSRALARTLFPEIKEDDELFFIVGNGNCTFEGYDGQPVIIWDDMRAIDMISVLGSRGNVFNVLDTHPTKQRQNIKYGSINLCNTVNIINSVQSYIEFLDGLAGEYKAKNGELVKSEDKGQAYRRIPFIINLHEEDFDLLINKGFTEHTKNFQEYEEYMNICGNFQKVRTALKHNEEMAKQIESQMLSLPKKKYDEIIEAENEEVNVDDEELLKQFENYGKIKDEDKDIIINPYQEETPKDFMKVPKYDLFD